MPASVNRWVSGAICTAFFEPGLGLFPLAHDWRELEYGSVQAKLRASGLETQIPGEPGDSVVESVWPTSCQAFVEIRRNSGS